MGFNYTPDPSYLVRGETQVSRKCHRLKPKFGGTIIPIYVHVRWFTGFVAVPVEPIGPFS